MFSLLRPPLLLRPHPIRHFTTSTNRLATKYRRFGDPIKAPFPPPSVSSPSSSQSTALQGIRLPFDKSRFDRFRKNPPVLILVLGTGGVVYYVAHLERVPSSGRLRFMDVSTATEREQGNESLQQILAQYRSQILPSRDRRAQFVQRVVNRLVQSNGLTTGQGDWDVYVIEENQRNAFVIPGGHIFVFTGILDVCKDEDGLAVVLGHELAHQVARHSAERMSSLKVLFALSLVLSTLGIDFGLSRTLLNLLMTLPNSRTAESEADYIGLLLSTQACYDPTVASSFWSRMQAAEGSSSTSSIDFLSTHPASGKRVQNVEKWSKEMIEKRPGDCGPLREQVGAFRGAARSTLWR